MESEFTDEQAEKQRHFERIRLKIEMQKEEEKQRKLQQER